LSQNICNNFSYSHLLLKCTTNRCFGKTPLAPLYPTVHQWTFMVSLKLSHCFFIISQSACWQELVHWSFTTIGWVLLHSLSETLSPHALVTLGTLSPWQLFRTPGEKRWETKWQSKKVKNFF